MRQEPLSRVTVEVRDRHTRQKVRNSIHKERATQIVRDGITRAGLTSIPTDSSRLAITSGSSPSITNCLENTGEDKAGHLLRNHLQANEHQCSVWSISAALLHPIVHSSLQIL